MKCIIFDFDGTIADTTRIIIKIMDALSEKHGYNKIGSIDNLRDMSYTEAAKYLGIPKHKLAQLLAEGYKLRKQMKDRVPIYRGIKTLLKKLKNYDLALISRSSTENLYDFIRFHNLEGIFNEVIGGNPLTRKHMQIKQFIKQKKYLKDDVIYIADEIRDISSARKAGVKIISVTWGFNSRHALEKHCPDWIVDSASEILSIIEADG